MKRFIALLAAVAWAAATTALAAPYSTEATMSLQKDEGTYRVDVRVSRLEERNGQLAEQLISEPRIQSAPGVPATLYSGSQPTNAGFANEENVTVDVTWPYPNESGVASCVVTVKLGDKVVSMSKLKLQIEGRGRTPLIVSVQDVDPKSVRAVDEKSEAYVLLEFNGKTKEEVKKIANENYGNKVEVRDGQGRLTEGGISLGTYKEIGMAVHYKSKDEAEHIAGILRGENPK